MIFICPFHLFSSLTKQKYQTNKTIASITNAKETTVRLLFTIALFFFNRSLILDRSYFICCRTCSACSGTCSCSLQSFPGRKMHFYCIWCSVGGISSHKDCFPFSGNLHSFLYSIKNSFHSSAQYNSIQSLWRFLHDTSFICKSIFDCVRVFFDFVYCDYKTFKTFRIYSK